MNPEFEYKQGVYYYDEDISPIECKKCGKFLGHITIEHIDNEQIDQRFEILEKLQKNDVMIECNKCILEDSERREGL